MSAGPSSSGAVLGLAYMSPIMLLHQILEPEEEEGVRTISHRIPGDQQQCPPASGHTGARNQGDTAGRQQEQQPLSLSLSPVPPPLARLQVCGT